MTFPLCVGIFHPGIYAYFQNSSRGEERAQHRAQRLVCVGQWVTGLDTNAQESLVLLVTQGRHTRGH